MESTAVAQRFVDAGHHNFTCATVAEVEGMAAAGFGTDLLLNIDGIWFEEDAEWYAIEDLA